MPTDSLRADLGRCKRRLAVQWSMGMFDLWEGRKLFFAISELSRIGFQSHLILHASGDEIFNMV